MILELYNGVQISYQHNYILSIISNFKTNNNLKFIYLFMVCNYMRYVNISYMEKVHLKQSHEVFNEGLVTRVIKSIVRKKF